MANAEKPQSPKSPRPQSIMAQNFAMDLDSVFGLSAGSGKLMETVEEKKQAVSTQNAELEALEAQLKAMEERLEQAKPGASARKPVQKGAAEEKTSVATTSAKSEMAAKTNQPKNPARAVEDSDDSDDDEEDEDTEGSSDDTSAEENPRRRK